MDTLHRTDGKINIDIMQLLIIYYPHTFTYNKHLEVAYITHKTDGDGKINIDIMQFLIFFILPYLRITSI